MTSHACDLEAVCDLSGIGRVVYGLCESARARPATPSCGVAAR